eukprot:2142239-Amphidinium_carterae.1
MNKHSSLGSIPISLPCCTSSTSNRVRKSDRLIVTVVQCGDSVFLRRLLHASMELARPMPRSAHIVPDAQSRAQ